MKVRRRLVAVLAVICGAVGLTAVAAPVAQAASKPIFIVMNTDSPPPDGVYFRNSDKTSDTNKITGVGVFRNERVQLQCYVAGGDSVGSFGDRLWYYVNNVTRPTVGGKLNVGFLNAHYINDGKNANQIDPGVAPCVETTIRTENWAGYLAAGATFEHVHGEWTVPKVPSCSSGGNTGYNTESTWIGFGGSGSDAQALIQVGTETICTSSTASVAYRAFFQRVDANKTAGQDILSNADPGEPIDADIFFNPSTEAYVVNIRGNNSSSETIRSGTDSGVSGREAECIVEAEQLNGVLQPTSDFGTAKFTSCAASSSETVLGPQLALGPSTGLTIYPITMERNDLSTKAAVSGGGATGAPWTVTWREK